MRLLKVLSLTLAAAGVLAAQPSITNVENAASYAAQGLPNSGIAQGAIFVVTGTGLGPLTLTTAPVPFQSTALAGTSIAVTVGSTTVNALMYYASAAQLAALLPSNTPAGAGTMVVTYQGSASAAFTITVVANNVATFTVSQDGQGLAIATFPDYSLVSAIPGTGSLADTCTSPGQACPYTYKGAANPGDVITLWATGLGPVSGSDSSGAGLGQNMPGIPLQLWIGGVSVPVSYQGRSGCCVGEDQIIFTIPNNAPTGCAVPILMQIGTLVSNTTLMPIAAGGRTCIPQNASLNSSVVQALAAATGPIDIGFAQIGRQLFSSSSSGNFYEDFAQVSFGQASLTYNGVQSQPIVLSSLDTTPPGTCAAYSSSQSGNPPLITYNNGLDAGSLTLSGPLGPTPLTNRGGTPAQYAAVLSGQGTYFSQGNYTLSASNGKDVGPFSLKFTITQTPTWQSSDQNRLITAGVTRSNGFTLNWTGGSPAYNVVITGTSFTDGTGATGASFECLVPSSLNTFTVPAQVLYALPAGSFAEIDFRPALPAQSFSASGMPVGLFSFRYQTTVFLSFK